MQEAFEIIASPLYSRWFTPYTYVGVSSFAGAFLAARTADVDRDYRNAIPLYRKALELEPDNTEIRERLMIASFLSVVAWNFYGNPLIHPVFIGLICGTAAYWLGSLAMAKPRGAGLSEISKTAHESSR